MNSDIIVSIITVLGTMGASFAGVIVSSRLTNFRLQQLEKKVDLHNGYDGRLVAVEESAKSAHKRIDGLERK